MFGGGRICIGRGGKQPAPLTTENDMNLSAHQKTALVHIAREGVAGIHTRTVGMSTAYVLHRNGLVCGLFDTTRLTSDGYRAAAEYGFDLSEHCAARISHANRMLTTDSGRAAHWESRRAYWTELTR